MYVIVPIIFVIIVSDTVVISDNICIIITTINIIVSDC